MALILEQYISTLVLFGLGLGLVIIFKILNVLLAPKRDTSKQIEGLNVFIAYECGEVPVGDARSRFNFQYYVFALVFVVFDVVASLFVTWAVVIKQLQLNGLISISIFLGTVGIGFVYWWIRNALRWM